MNYSNLATVTAQAEKLSYSDTISLISTLVKKLKNENKSDKQSNFVSELFAISEKEPSLHKSSEKWTRDELHRY